MKEEIVKEVVGFYKGLLGTSAESLEGIDIRVIKQRPKIPSFKDDLLIIRLHNDEIDAALQSIHSSKAPRWDG